VGGGASLTSDSPWIWLYNYFFTQLYTLLYEKAEKAVGYKAQAETITLNRFVTCRDSLILMGKINVRVLAAIEAAVMTGEGPKTMIAAFSGKHSKIMRVLERSNEMVYPAGLDVIVDYWSQIFSPYPGGPLCYTLFDFQPISDGYGIVPTTALTNWTAAEVPNLNVSADIDALIADIEAVFAMVLNYAIVDAADVTDMRRVNSLYDMMKIKSPQTGLSGLKPMPDRWNEQFKRGLFHFRDNKGAGVDNLLAWPDMQGSNDTLISVRVDGYPYDDLDWIGAKYPLAIEFSDSATPGYAPESEHATVLGIVLDVVPLGGTPIFAPFWQVYTPEDGWTVLDTTLDFTAVSDVQKWLWSHPQIVHPESWRVIMSEESEETRLHSLDSRGGSVQIPLRKFGEHYISWIYNVYNLPHIT